MSNVKELFKAIITGKDYQEIFSQVIADKASQRIEQHKEVVAKSMFESSEHLDEEYVHTYMVVHDGVPKDHENKELVRLHGGKKNIINHPTQYKDSAEKRAKYLKDKGYVNVRVVTRKTYFPVNDSKKVDEEYHKEVVAKSMFEYAENEGRWEEEKHYKVGFTYRPDGDIKEATDDSESASVTQKKADYTEKIIVNKTGKKRKVYAKEDVDSDDGEELTELKSSTLASYVKKASHDVAAKGALTRHYGEKSERERKEGDYVNARKSNEKADKIFAKSWKRRENMAKAVDKLASRADESVDIEESDIDSND